MYINTFKYSPEDVSCHLCTEYVKKVGCTALRCPWLAERIEAGVVGYREAISSTMPRPAIPMLPIARPVTPRSFLRSMKVRSHSIRRQRSFSMTRASRNSPLSRVCRPNTPR